MMEDGFAERALVVAEKFALKIDSKNRLMFTINRPAVIDCDVREAFVEGAKWARGEMQAELERAKGERIVATFKMPMFHVVNKPYPEDALDHMIVLTEKEFDDWFEKEVKPLSLLAENYMTRLAKFGRHTIACASNFPVEHFNGKTLGRECNCGWDEARAALKDGGET